MLMPGRYVSDTTSKCVTISQTKWTQNWQIQVYALADWVWPGLATTGGATATASQVVVTTMPQGMDVSFTFDAAPTLENKAYFTLTSVTGRPRISIVETLSTGEVVELTSISPSSSGTYTLNYTPTASDITFKIKGTSSGTTVVNWDNIQIWKPEVVQTEVLVDICEKDSDRYPYGFNGQIKTNEWAGIGNFMEFSERGYDSRIGRFLAIDPITRKYPWYTPYQFAGNTPIMAIDLEGLEPFITNLKAIYHDDGHIEIKADVQIKAKVLNMSSEKELDMNVVAANLQSDIVTSLDGAATAIFSLPFDMRKNKNDGNYDVVTEGIKVKNRSITYNINVSANITAVSSIDQIGKDDWVYALVDKVIPGKGRDAIGIANYGGKVSIGEASYYKVGADPQKGRHLALHEFAHLLGTFDIYDDPAKDDKSNAMSNAKGLNFNHEQKAKEVWQNVLGPPQNIWRGIRKSDYSRPKGKKENEDTKKQLKNFVNQNALSR